MAAAAPLPGGPGPERIQGLGSKSQGEKRLESNEGGVVFRALLEKLEVQAQELKNQASGVEKPDDLAGAVGQAQESLEQALSLSDRLVEAFRQSLQQERGEAPRGEPDQKPT